MICVQLKMIPTYFPSPSDLRNWFEMNHANSQELWVGFYKKGSGKQSITWPESVDEALSFGWIDGIRKSIDDTCYNIRFTPRKPASIWSSVNIKRAQELIASGRMRPAGLQAFGARKENRSGIYSYEQRPKDLTGHYLGMLKENGTAWAFFQSKSPSYRRAVTCWVISAKREVTRLKRTRTLIEYSEKGITLPQFTPIVPPKRAN
jgi:uncharacterized protein YdeI (YjbR/CyaY-like superfamily)